MAINSFSDITETVNDTDRRVCGAIIACSNLLEISHLNDTSSARFLFYMYNEIIR